MRSELSKKASEVDAERVARIEIQKETKQKIEIVERQGMAAVAAVETDKLFLQREMEEMKERLRKAQEGKSPGEKRLLGRVKMEKEESRRVKIENEESFPNMVDFESTIVEKVKKTVTADTETQTEGKKKRRVRLKIDKSLPELDFVR